MTKESLDENTKIVNEGTNEGSTSANNEAEEVNKNQDSNEEKNVETEGGATKNPEDEGKEEEGDKNQEKNAEEGEEEDEREKDSNWEKKVYEGGNPASDDEEEKPKPQEITDGDPEEGEEEDEEYEEEEYEEEEEEEEEEGGYFYTMDDLLQLKNCSESQKEPEISEKVKRLPIFQQPTPNQQNRQKNNANKNNQRQRGGKGGNNNSPRPPSKQSNKIQQDFGLHKAENKWQRRAPKGDTEAILGIINGILNKVTADNLEKLSQKLIEKLIDDKDLLSGVIDLIFEKALGSTKFSQVYASLCKILNTKATVFEAVTGDQKGFLRMLAQKCQNQFFEAKLLGIGSKAQADYTPDELQHLNKLYYVGNIKFIGELYMEGLLAVAVIKICMDKLLNQELPITMEESIESLSKMLSIIGPRLEKEGKTQALLNNCFSALKGRLSKDTPNRVRFMILNLIELRENKWIPRSQIKSKNVNIANTQQQANWKAASSPAVPTGGSTPVKPSVSLKSSQQQQKLAPAPKFPQPSASQQPRKSAMKVSGTQIPVGDKGGAAVTVEVKSNAVTEEQAPPEQPVVEETPSPALTSKSVSFGSAASSSQFDPEKLKRQSTSWLEEYFDIQEEEEVEACISEASVPPEHLHTFVVTALNLLTQKRTDLIGRLFVYLHKQSILSVPAFRAAIEELSSTIEDSTEELPNFPGFVGQVLGKLIVNNILPCSYLTILATDELIPSRIPLRLYGSVFNVIQTELGSEKLQSLLSENSIVVSTFAKEADRNQEALSKYMKSEVAALF